MRGWRCVISSSSFSCSFSLAVSTFSCSRPGSLFLRGKLCLPFFCWFLLSGIDNVSRRLCDKRIATVMPWRHRCLVYTSDAAAEREATVRAHALRAHDPSWGGLLGQMTVDASEALRLVGAVFGARQ